MAPLGSGFLTGTVSEPAADDFRRNNPRYQGENLATNRQRFAPLMRPAGFIWRNTGGGWRVSRLLRPSHIPLWKPMTRKLFNS